MCDSQASRYAASSLVAPRLLRIAHELIVLTTGAEHRARHRVHKHPVEGTVIPDGNHPRNKPLIACGLETADKLHFHFAELIRVGIEVGFEHFRILQQRDFVPEQSHAADGAA